MTFMRELTIDEENAIEELRTRTYKYLSPKLTEDPTLFYRFLKARDFDVDKAEKMLLKHITWRKINQVDTILEDFKPKEYFLRYVNLSVLGTDKDGDLLLFARGKIDSLDVLKCDRINHYKKCWIWFSEVVTAALKEQNQKTGRKCERFAVIIDLNQLTFSNAIQKTTADLWMNILYIFQDNYPERLKKAYIINAPSYYVIPYMILKAVMSDAMIQKHQLYGRNGWKEKLLNDIDADVLPAFLGGNRTDPDGNPLCLTLLNDPGKISPKYYLSKEDRYFEDTSEIKRTTIPHSEIEEICLDIAEAGSNIRWEYLVKSKDIKFGLSFQESEQSSKEEIIPLAKYSTPDGTEIGSYKTHSSGKYIIIFDNSHSWMNSKEIEYCLTVSKSV